MANTLPILDAIRSKDWSTATEQIHSVLQQKVHERIAQERPSVGKELVKEAAEKTVTQGLSSSGKVVLVAPGKISLEDAKDRQSQVTKVRYVTEAFSRGQKVRLAGRSTLGGYSALDRDGKRRPIPTGTVGEVVRQDGAEWTVVWFPGWYESGMIKTRDLVKADIWEAWEKDPNCQQCRKPLSAGDAKLGRVCGKCASGNKGKIYAKESLNLTDIQRVYDETGGDIPETELLCGVKNIRVNDQGQVIAAITEDTAEDRLYNRTYGWDRKGRVVFSAPGRLTLADVREVSPAVTRIEVGGSNEYDLETDYGFVNFSVYKYKPSEGPSLKDYIARLARAGVPAEPSRSPYVDMVAVKVPAKYDKKAGKVLFGESRWQGKGGLDPVPCGKKCLEGDDVDADYYCGEGKPWKDHKFVETEAKSAACEKCVKAEGFMKDLKGVGKDIKAVGKDIKGVGKDIVKTLFPKRVRNEESPPFVPEKWVTCPECKGAPRKPGGVLDQCPVCYGDGKIPKAELKTYYREAKGDRSESFRSLRVRQLVEMTDVDAVEASDLGWKPGEWPKVLKLNGNEYSRTGEVERDREGDIVYVVYRFSDFYNKGRVGQKPIVHVYND